MDYQPPPAFGPPESRVGPLHPDEVVALLAAQSGPTAAPPAARARPATDRRSPRVWLALACVCAAALLLAGVVVLQSDPGGHRHVRSISLPDAAAGHRLIRSIDGRTVEALLASQLGSLGAIQGALDAAKVGVYGVGQSGGPTVVFIGFNGADDSGIAQLLDSTGAGGVVSQVMSGAGSTAPKAIGPGPLGGAVQCAQASENGTAFTPCVWADADTVAVVLQVGLVDVDSAGVLTLQFRSAAEH